MTIGVPAETDQAETRVALIPDSVKKIRQWGDIPVMIQAGAGVKAGYPDEAYREAGAEIVSERMAVFSAAQAVLMVTRPEPKEVKAMSPGAMLICQLDPFHEKTLIRALAAGGVTAVSLEMIPRSTLAQKMDVLSSQASLAGYMAVIRAADRLGRIFPMMMTPAGTISPSRVFVIGAGVAGLQAVATARRLGANVSAFDTRPVVEEQVQSLGARFVKLDLGETGQTKDGYARALTEEQLQMQRDLMAKVCGQSDVVITTAKLFGRKAPLIITREMIAGMKKGSLIIDMAVDSGGNVEGSRAGEISDFDGVSVLGYEKSERDAPYHASQMFSGNVTAFLETFRDGEGSGFDLTREDDILTGCVITRDGSVVHERFRDGKEE